MVRHHFVRVPSTRATRQRRIRFPTRTDIHGVKTSSPFFALLLDGTGTKTKLPAEKNGSEIVVDKSLAADEQPLVVPTYDRSPRHFLFANIDIE